MHGVTMKFKLDNLLGLDGCLLHYYLFVTVYSVKGIGLGKGG